MPVLWLTMYEELDHQPYRETWASKSFAHVTVLIYEAGLFRIFTTDLEGEPNTENHIYLEIEDAREAARAIQRCCPEPQPSPLGWWLSLGLNLLLITYLIVR